MGFGLGSIAGPIFDVAMQGWQNYETHRSQGIAQGQAQNQMDFQERMRNTSHQAEVEDLKKAGLNPILSAGGQGAPAPSGASAPIAVPTINMPDMMAYGISLKQLEQVDRRLQLDGDRAAAEIAEKVSAKELNEIRKALGLKELESPMNQIKGGAGKILKEIIKQIQDNFHKPKLNGLDPVAPGTEGAPMSLR